MYYPMSRSSYPAPSPDESLEVFGKPAGWMLHWGTSIVVVLAILLLALAAFIRYPDKVQFEVFITTHPPPLPIVNRNDGIIKDIAAADGDTVQEGAILLVFDTPANLVDISYLDSLLQDLQKVSSPTELLDHTPREPLQLGELGYDYTQLLNTTMMLQDKWRRQPILARIRYIDAQVKELGVLRNNLNDQLETLRLELAIAERNLQQFEELLQREAASQIEVDQSATRFLGVQRRIEEQQNRLSQNRSQEAQIQEARAALQAEAEDELLNLWLQWRAQLRALQQQFFQWNETHVLRANTDGTLIFFTPLTPGQQLLQNQTPLGIVPSLQTPDFLAEGLLPDLASGDIKVGSEGYLEILAYPASSYGRVIATVQSIALAPQTAGEGYRITLSLPEGLQSTHQHDLPFRQQMMAKATLLTKKSSLLGRLFARLRNLNAPL